MRHTRRFVIGILALALAAAACSSGPSAKTLSDDRLVATTTTTEPPPPDTAIVKIVNGAFRPAILEVDLEVTPIVEWRHEDEGSASNDDPVYQISVVTPDGRVTSDELHFGDAFAINFGDLPPDIYRYQAFQGLNRLPGTVDTRPDQ